MAPKLPDFRLTNPQTGSANFTHAQRSATQSKIKTDTGKKTTEAMKAHLKNPPKRPDKRAVKSSKIQPPSQFKVTPDKDCRDVVISLFDAIKSKIKEEGKDSTADIFSEENHGCLQNLTENFSKEDMECLTKLNGDALLVLQQSDPKIFSFCLHKLNYDEVSLILDKIKAAKDAPQQKLYPPVIIEKTSTIGRSVLTPTETSKEAPIPDALIESYKKRADIDFARAKYLILHKDDVSEKELTSAVNKIEIGDLFYVRNKSILKALVQKLIYFFRLNPKKRPEILKKNISLNKEFNEAWKNHQIADPALKILNKKWKMLQKAMTRLQKTSEKLQPEMLDNLGFSFTPEEVQALNSPGGKAALQSYPGLEDVVNFFIDKHIKQIKKDEEIEKSGLTVDSLLKRLDRFSELAKDPLNPTLTLSDAEINLLKSPQGLKAIQKKPIKYLSILKEKDRDSILSCFKDKAWVKKQMDSIPKPPVLHTGRFLPSQSQIGSIPSRTDQGEHVDDEFVKPSLFFSGFSPPLENIIQRINKNLPLGEITPKERLAMMSPDGVQTIKTALQKHSKDKQLLILNKLLQNVKDDEIGQLFGNIFLELIPLDQSENIIIELNENSFAKSIKTVSPFQKYRLLAARKHIEAAKTATSSSTTASIPSQIREITDIEHLRRQDPSDILKNHLRSQVEAGSLVHSPLNTDEISIFCEIDPDNLKSLTRDIKGTDLNKLFENATDTQRKHLETHTILQPHQTQQTPAVSPRASTKTKSDKEDVLALAATASRPVPKAVHEDIQKADVLLKQAESLKQQYPNFEKPVGIITKEDVDDLIPQLEQSITKLEILFHDLTQKYADKSENIPPSGDLFRDQWTQSKLDQIHNAIVDLTKLHNDLILKSHEEHEI